MTTSRDKMELARRHLRRVVASWDDPTDWDDLSLYGFYCLEAAALHFGLPLSRKHWEKVQVAETLHTAYGLPDIADLLRELNDARKWAAYGDVRRPDMDAKDVAIEIEHYVEAVEAALGGKRSP